MKTLALAALAVIGLGAATAPAQAGSSVYVSATWSAPVSYSSSYTPVYTAPVYNAPVYSAPVYSTPTYAVPSYSAPTYSTQTYTVPSYYKPVTSYYAPAPVYTAPTYYTPRPVYNSTPYVSFSFGKNYGISKHRGQGHHGHKAHNKARHLGKGYGHAQHVRY